MSVKVLSLDISSVCTGWAFVECSKEWRIAYGVIKNRGTCNQSEKLTNFRKELIRVLEKYKPTNVVIEDVYQKINVKTYGVLSKFVGVAQGCCFEFLGVDPYIISTKTVKSFFKAKDKGEVFAFVVHLLGLKGFTFKHDNDITDAIAQLLCYCDGVLSVKNFRTKKEYGFLYEV